MKCFDRNQVCYVLYICAFNWNTFMSEQKHQTKKFIC